VSWLAPHVSKFDFGKSPIAQIGLGLENANVVTVNETDVVATALQKIQANSVGGVGIVDKHGKLIGNFSATDLKYFGIKSNTLHIGQSTMNDFLHALQVPQITGIEYPYTVTKANTTHQVVQKFVDTKAHRLYVVDKEGKPIGVIALLDLIELFFRHILIE